MRIYLLVLMLSLSSFIFAQNQVLPIQNDFFNRNISRLQLKTYLMSKSKKFHSAVLPYEFLDSTVVVSPDSLFQKAKFNLKLPNNNHSFYELEPLLGLSSSIDPSTSILGQRYIAGLRGQARFSNKFHLRASVLAGYLNSPADSINWTRTRILDGVSTLSKSNDAFDLFNFTTALTYTPNDIFSFQIGKGKHFFGDGYRSLLLSANALSYPYAKIRTRIWNIEYVNLYSKHKSYSLDTQGDIVYGDKYSVSHFLSWNINSKVNAYLFETIIWQNDDSINTRGFDINYINPVIFFRPVEYSIGSSDNAIIGLGSSWKASKKTQIYTQIVIDEMIFKQVFYSTGWWANKYGVQLGVKSFDVFNTRDTYLQLEWNHVRPYTYSHGSTKQNYAHYSQALAHPLGSNFYEVLAIFRKDINNIAIEYQAKYALMGHDPIDQNMGGDIFRSYIDPYKTYDNVVGQGIKEQNLLNSITLSYIFKEKSDAKVYLSYQNTFVDIEGMQSNYNYISFGLSMNMK